MAVNLILVRPKLVDSQAVALASSPEGRFGYSHWTQHVRVWFRVGPRTDDTLDRVEVDRAGEEAVVTEFLPGNDGNHSLDIDLIAAECIVNIGTERNTASDDVLGGLVVREPIDLFEDRFQRVRERRVPNVVEKGSGTHEAAVPLRTRSGRERALPTRLFLARSTIIFSVPADTREWAVRTSTPPGRSEGGGTSSSFISPLL